ncbi:hypothetical protein M9194_14280 [Vibrio sp. S4M6]|uniref:hypothetical protein n=1 Tax=Vibrio sinus TaxID=2946865 RepID=UPI00202AADC0|nr:hypothetical protein [Vibrio sinus]MCL9782600.1 hypothetical protein [Vibrio sinus]
MKLRMFSTVASLAIVLSGCAATANTEVYPTEHGYKAISMSSDESAAIKDSLLKAKLQCQSLNESYVVISQQSTYNGIDKNIKDAANIVSNVVSLNSDTVFTTGPLNSDDDYRVVTVFKCKADHSIQS